MKVTPAKPPVQKIVMNTKGAKKNVYTIFKWFDERDEDKQCKQMLSTAGYIKEHQTWRIRQIAVNIRMYAGLSVYSYAGSNVSKMDENRSLPDDRPTFNLIQSCTDTLVSRLGQNRPVPVFLTDNADYRQRHVAQQLNGFVLGEFHQTKAYEKATDILRDGIVTGTGALKVFRDNEDKVSVERRLVSNLYFDINDSINGDPQVLYEFALMNRDMVKTFINSRLQGKEKNDAIETVNSAGNARTSNAPNQEYTTADQIMVVEAWKLSSTKDAKDGVHIVACEEGVIFREVFTKTKFPFVWFQYSKPWLGFWSQGLATQLFGTQITLNRILFTIARAITLVGVPRVFIEQNSKVSKAANNNEIGVCVTYSGTKPSYEVAPCNAPELYNERDKLIAYGYQQTGVSAMQAASQKPAGIDSGEAIRSYDNIATDRMASLSRKFDNVFIDLAYLITDTAMDIAIECGSYQTVYPNKDGTKEIDLPNIKFLQDPFTIQVYSESSLPKEPAGRMQKVTEMVQAGMISLKEGRRLLSFPDLGQMEKLANASEERIFQCLDKIVEKGKYTQPDQFMDLGLAEELVVQYINLYFASKLETEKRNMLVDFFNQIQVLKQKAIPAQIGPTPPVPGSPQVPAQASPAPLPQSPLVPNAIQPAAPAAA